MGTFTKIARTLSLVMLSGGSAAIVFAAVVLVKAATAKGIPVAEAATANAPLFIAYSRVALGSAVVLLVAEILDLITNKNKTGLSKVRYVSSIISITAAFAFALGIVPPLEELLPMIAQDPAAHEKFHKLHEMSRVIFGISILGAFASLLIPLFGKNEQTNVLASSSAAKAVETT